MPWTFVSLAADGRTIKVTYDAGDGDCVQPVALEVDQTATQVTVAAWSKSTARAGQACADPLVQAAGSITLDAPLGDRTLLHAPISKAF
jgi:hypothetical protein